jgi:alpha-ribazole phosphatase/probable phosphoglycerate mutase
MVTRVNLIRHGETEGAETKRYKGHIEVPLSDNGMKQIKRLSEYLSQNTDLNAVYTSDLGRAMKSAEIIAGPYGLKPVIIKALRERNFGVWEGMSFDEIKEKYPDTFNAWTENPLQFSPIEGESTIEVKDRALKAFNEITGMHNSDNIAVVAHGGINRVILCELLGIPLENIFRIEQDFAALNVIELWDYPVVKHINFVV